jgi:hypothetical protein
MITIRMNCSNASKIWTFVTLGHREACIHSDLSTGGWWLSVSRLYDILSDLEPY